MKICPARKHCVDKNCSHALPHWDHADCNIVCSADNRSIHYSMRTGCQHTIQDKDTVLHICSAHEKCSVYPECSHKKPHKSKENCDHECMLHGYEVDEDKRYGHCVVAEDSDL